MYTRAMCAKRDRQANRSQLTGFGGTRQEEVLKRAVPQCNNNDAIYKGTYAKASVARAYRWIAPLPETSFVAASIFFVRQKSGK